MVARLLETGAPFIIRQPEGADVAEGFQAAVVTKHEFPADQRAEAVAELRAYIDEQQATGLGRLTDTLFFEKSVRLFWFDFGKSDRENIDISQEVLKRMGPSLSIPLPAFVLGIAINLFVAMIVAYCRGTYVDRSIAVICIVMMSILSLFYYFSAQFVFGAWLKVFPFSGYQYGLDAVPFVMMPILASLFVGFGGGVRFYRTIFLEEVNREYVRTARAKGLAQHVVLFKHVLKNAMIPILTNVVLVIPMLFTGSLILENFFGIPGLGSFTIEALQAQDFRIVGSMVYLGAFLYIVGLLMTDLSYTLVDPRVNLE